jgi:hypothetical protein
MRDVGALVAVLAGAIVLIAGCGSSRTATTTTTSGVSLASSRAQQIALARSSNDLFSIFPERSATKPCGIPEGGVHFKPLRGTCRTSIRVAATHEPALLVAFTETWPVPTCPPGAFCPVMPVPKHTWTVVEGEPVVTTGSHLRILATRQSGTIAPQYYK